jgi:pseudaminic acid synthase
MSEEIIIGQHLLGPHVRPFIVAELSGNHNGSLKRALQLVEEAHKAGVQAIKLQTYTADTMTLNINKGHFFIEDKNSLWKGRTLYDLYQEAHTPWEWHAPIFEKARSLGLAAFSTPFDATSIDFLETLDVPCYKIASLEIVDHALIAKAASTKKPLIISTGGATEEEIKEAVLVAKNAGCRQLVLLKCTSAYPAPPESMNLKTIPDMQSKFGCLVGLSDHSLGVGAAVASIPLGACLIEKHITLSRDEDGVDAKFSLEPHEFKMLVEETIQAWKAQGKVFYGIDAAEQGTLLFRRSLYFVRDIKKGQLITQDDIRAIRPGDGLAPKHLATLIGKRAAVDISLGTPTSWKLVTN